MPDTHQIGRRAALGGAIALGARAAAAQEAGTWPQRPVRLINSGAPGSGIDLVARLLAEGLAQGLGQPFLVENRPGGGAVLAAQTHAGQRPGESLLLGATGIASTLPLTFAGRLPYDPEADLSPIGIVATEFLCLAVQATLPVSDPAGLFALARARPGALNWYSVPGYAELDMRLFLHQREIEASFVAYQGSPPAVLDLVAGRIQFAVLPLTPLLGSLREGGLRVLAVTSSQPAPTLPSVPTLAEAGFPELRYDPFTALFGWRGMPQALRDRVASMAAARFAEPEVAARLAQAGILPQAGGPAALAAVIAAQRQKMTEAVRLVGLRQG